MTKRNHEYFPPVNFASHELIAGMAEEYADHHASAGEEKDVRWPYLAASYITGAERTLHKVMDVIGYISTLEECDRDTARKIGSCINDIFHRKYMPDEARE